MHDTHCNTLLKHIIKICSLGSLLHLFLTYILQLHEKIGSKMIKFCKSFVILYKFQRIYVDNGVLECLLIKILTATYVCISG